MSAIGKLSHNIQNLFVHELNSSGIYDLLVEGPVAFYFLINRANRPAGLIQDQPRGLFTDFFTMKSRLL